MKNLKKLLALVLVAAMVLSVGALSASAAFTDTAKSDYIEAIEVLAGIGVINGTTSTTYEPNGNLDRASAAKIITYLMLGPTNAAMISKASSQIFKDVPTSHWASGYIDYCASQGIVSGVGDGSFNPSGTLTTLAFTKMLLVALGYNADIEGYVGSNWAINIASDAISAGISDTRISMSTTAVCTREQAAQLAFKTLTAKTVKYEGGTTITIGDSTIVTGATMKYVPGSELPGENYDGDTGDGYMQFCEKNFPDLSLAPGQTDAFGRPSVIWTNRTTEIGTYPAKPVVSYNGFTLASKIAADLKGYKLPDDSVNTVYYNIENTTVYTDVAGLFTTGPIIKGNAIYTDINVGEDAAGAAAHSGETVAAALQGETGNGKVVEFYANRDKQITAIVEITYSVGKISAVTTTGTYTNYTIVKPNGVTVGSYKDFIDDTLYTDTIYMAGSIAKDDIVTYVVQNGKAYVYPTTTVTGVATNVGSIYFTQSVTVAGTTYTAGAAVTDSTASYKATTLSANYYIDQFGFVVLTTATAASGDYAYIIGKYAKTTTDVNGTVPSAQVKVVKADGTVAVYNVSLTKLSAISSVVTTPTAALNNPAGAALDIDTSDPADGTDDAVQLAAGDYIITGTNILVYDASEGIANTTVTMTAAIGDAGDVCGYTLAEDTIKLEPLGTTLAAGAVTFDTAVSGVGVDKTSSVAAGGTALYNASTIYVIYCEATKTATVYNGITALPSAATAAGIVAKAGANNGNVVMVGNSASVGTAKYVFLTIDTPFGSAVTTDYVYIDALMYGTSLNASGVTVYSYTGYKADGTTLPLTYTGTALAVSGVYKYNADNTVSNSNLLCTTTYTANTNHAAGYIYDESLVIIDSLLGVTNTTPNPDVDVYYNITSDTKIVYVNPALGTAHENGGYVILAKLANGSPSTNIATIFVTKD